MKKKQQARQSVERLFAEPFIPQWMAGQEETELHALNEYVTNGVDQLWRKEAEESRRRIADKYPSSAMLSKMSRLRAQQHRGLTRRVSEDAADN